MHAAATMSAAPAPLRSADVRRLEPRARCPAAWPSRECGAAATAAPHCGSAGH